MTGDGVNDVLSLKQANLGIAMQSGSQATRSAADIVLLHDSFGALPNAFREGQRIRRGLCRILELFLSRVFAVTLLILAVLIVQAGFPLSPGQISLLTLLTVGIPTFGIALWTPPGLPPRNLPLRLLQFVLPASSLLALASFSVYLGVYLLNDIDLPSLRAGGVAAATVAPGDRPSQPRGGHPCAGAGRPDPGPLCRAAGAVVRGGGGDGWRAAAGLSGPGDGPALRADHVRAGPAQLLRVCAG